MMHVSLDGGETFQEVDEVRVVYTDQRIPGEDDNYGELHLVMTPEGFVTDVWCVRPPCEGHNVATQSETTGELLERLVEQDK